MRIIGPMEALNPVVKMVIMNLTLKRSLHLYSIEKCINWMPWLQTAQGLAIVSLVPLTVVLEVDLRGCKEVPRVPLQLRKHDKCH